MTGNIGRQPNGDTNRTGGVRKGAVGSLLTIIQYNCGNANHRLARPFFDSLDPGQHHIVAVQEPYFNTRTKSTYVPPGYHLVYHPEAPTRVCVMVSKQLDVRLWAGHAVCEDIAVLTLETERGPIDVKNVYNPKPLSPRSRVPSRLAT